MARRHPPQALDHTFLLLGVQARFYGRLRRACCDAPSRHVPRTLDEIEETLDGEFPVTRLSASGIGEQDDASIAGGTLAGQIKQSEFNRRRFAEQCDVDVQLYGSRNLVDVLTAGSARAHEIKPEGSLWNLVGLHDGSSIIRIGMAAAGDCVKRLFKRLVVTLAWVSVLPAMALADSSDRFGLNFGVHFNQREQLIEATIDVDQSRSVLDFIDFKAPEDRFSAFKAEGRFERTGERVRWHPPRKGGKLRYRYTVDRPRGEGFDAKFEKDWTLFRLDRLFPGARVRTSKGSEVNATLRLSGPKGWAIESRYGKWLGKTHTLPVESRSSYRRPTGWVMAGEIGIRRDVLAAREVAVAGPVGQAVRRQDMLAFLAWTLPELVRVFPDMPKNLLIVSAGDPMWRGGLSGPGSYYLHAERPLITENGTSPVLHELIHVASRRRMADGEDWLVEGLAEYYSLLFLRRSGGITEDRFNKSLDAITKVANEGKGKLRDPSRGPDTARAAVKIADLDRRLPGGLDAWIASVPKGKKIDCASLAEYAKRHGTAFWGCTLAD